MGPLPVRNEESLKKRPIALSLEVAMKSLVNVGVVALLICGLLGAERAVAQANRVAIPTGPANNHLNFGSIGFGGHGYGGYGYGGGYGGGWRNPYNPYSPYSPFNPYSPYSPYNPISPISPYYSPYNAGAFTAAYLYNPLYNP